MTAILIPHSTATGLANYGTAEARGRASAGLIQRGRLSLDRDVGILCAAFIRGTADAVILLYDAACASFSEISGSALISSMTVYTIINSGCIAKKRRCRNDVAAVGTSRVRTRGVCDGWAGTQTLSVRRSAMQGTILCIRPALSCSPICRCGSQ